MAAASSSGLSSVLEGGEDTIVARATPPGRSALAVVRVSGGATLQVLRAVAPSWISPEPWKAGLVRLQVGDVEDEAVAVFYRGPRSYTGEDMAELMVHGSPWLVEALQDALVAAGARRAGPGEFTRRAVANGKLDLVAAEGIRDLIEAETRWQARVARARMDGTLAARVGELRERLLSLLVRVEGALDYGPQGVDYDPAAVERELQALVHTLRGLAAAARAARLPQGGIRVVIAGPPNAGKSSLFNQLLSMERAIVSPRPGTTRDVVEATVSLEGRPVTLVDTAGLRSTRDEVEEEGVRRTIAALAEADVVLLLRGADQPWQEPEGLAAGGPLIRVLTRIDLAPETEAVGWIPACLVDGRGVGAVRGALAAAVRERLPEEAGEGLLSPRQAELAEAAAAELKSAPLTEPELLAESLRWAAARMAEMAGEVSEEAVLDRLFATFCVGK